MLTSVKNAHANRALLSIPLRLQKAKRIFRKGSSNVGMFQQGRGAVCKNFAGDKNAMQSERNNRKKQVCLQNLIFQTGLRIESGYMLTICQQLILTDKIIVFCYFVLSSRLLNCTNDDPFEERRCSLLMIIPNCYCTKNFFLTSNLKLSREPQ